MKTLVTDIAHGILSTLNQTTWSFLGKGRYLGVYNNDEWKVEVFVARNSVTDWTVNVCIYLPNCPQRETVTVDIDVNHETIQSYYDPMGKGQRTEQIDFGDEERIIQRFKEFFC